jgi:hypothetical protein
MGMILTERQWDWILGSFFAVLMIIILAVAFWPENRRRHRRGGRP